MIATVLTFDILSFGVQVVDDCLGVVVGRGSKNVNIVVTVELFEQVLAMRPHFEHYLQRMKAMSLPFCLLMSLPCGLATGRLNRSGSESHPGPRRVFLILAFGCRCQQPFA